MRENHETGDDLTCPNCKNSEALTIDRHSRYANSENIEFFLICELCGYKTQIYRNCARQLAPSQGSSSFSINSRLFCIVSISVVIFFIYVTFSNFSVTNKRVTVNDLRNKYPLQKDETWYNVLNALENGEPSVKSVIFLHSEDKRTSDCLANDLVSMFSPNEIVNLEDITFSNLGGNTEDFGFVLEHYRPILKKFRVLKTDLTAVTGNIARIFHSLCDEVSSDIKPSLFIFTLKDDKKIKYLKPIERAASILRKAWNDLPQSEMYPLLSRVVKIVIDVVPEKKVIC